MTRLKVSIVVAALFALAACSRDPQVLVANGNKFFEREKYKEAAIMYRRALQRDARFGEAYYRLGLASMKLGNFGDAYKALWRVMELQPDNADAAARLADLILLAAAQSQAQAPKRLEEADELADRLLALDSESYDGHRLKGQIAMLRKDAKTAVAELEKALKLKPDVSGLSAAYFTALVQSGRFPEAEKVAREVIARDPAFGPIYDLLYEQYAQRKQLPEAEGILKTKVRNNPSNSNYVLQLAAHYSVVGDSARMNETMALLADSKRYPDGRLMAGDFLFLRMREFERARQQYEAGLQEVPAQKALFQKRLVELYAATNRGTDANKLLAEIERENPRDPDVLPMRAALRLSTGSAEEIAIAATELQSLVAKNPSNHLLRFNLARALGAKGEIEPARMQLEEAIKLRPDFLAAREMLIGIYLAKQDPSRALAVADEILQLDPNNMTAHLSRSTALLLLGEREKSHQELDYLTANFPKNPEVQYRVGFQAWQEGDYRRASDVFGRLHSENPSDIRGLVGVVETLASQKRMDEAIQKMLKAVEAEPNRRDYRTALGNLYVRAERYDEAIQVFSDLVAKEPKAGDLLFRLGEAYRRKGDINKAIDVFRRASQANPNDVTSLLQLGLLMEGTGHRDQAKPIYEQILRIDPSHPVALNNLAFAKAEEGVDLDEALRLAQKARQAMPNSPDIADTLGWVYVRKQLTPEAIRIFTELAQKYPDNAVYRYHYGMALAQKGDKAAARREFEAALRNNPSRDDSARIQDMLKQL